MINSIFTLKALAAEWSRRLPGCRITDAWSQHRGELTIAIEGGGQLHVRLLAPVRCIFRSPRSGRQVRNAATVLRELRGVRIERISVVHGDRILAMELESGDQLKAYLFGAHANVYLATAEGVIRKAFRRDSDWADRMLPAPQAAGLPETHADFLSRWLPADQLLSRSLGRALRVFGRTLVVEVMHRANVKEKPAAGCSPRELERLFTSMCTIQKQFQGPQPTLYTKDNVFSLIPLQSFAHAEARTLATVDEAVRTCAKRALAQHALSTLRKPLYSTLTRAVAKAQRSVRALQKELQRASRAESYEHFGHLLMAAPVQAAGADSIVLPDILHERKPVTIALVPSLSTIENAERYYRRARRARSAHAALQQRAAAAASRAERLNALADELRRARTVAAVKALVAREGAVLRRLEIQVPAVARVPFRTYPLAPGYEARVAKSARDGDALILHHARPFDLWMHVRGTSGAHVVLRLPNRVAKPAAEVIRAAAALAAYHSKVRGSALVPVIVTPRKYVRKPKGAPPGVVTVEREDVLIVQPTLPRT